MSKLTPTDVLNIVDKYYPLTLECAHPTLKSILCQGVRNRYDWFNQVAIRKQLTCDRLLSQIAEHFKTYPFFVSEEEVEKYLQEQ